ncbi:LOW QUALITY PROTEIN: prolactin receptor-like [Scyliorhinus torazame]|uniref:LOW QUALITY PROTEIN: prolactin receptor-like n=1 Tax=Scyliorhinus torazame TaxID=75743 RepID=UPI003B5BCED3
MSEPVRLEVLPLLFIFLILLQSSPDVRAESAPEKPALSQCRSPDKETFTCWWQPPADRESLTNYSLWYSIEGDSAELECPDYVSMGPNSCFFDRESTSIWTIYTITIIATNRVGSIKSDPVFIDVTYIVQPDPPINVSLEMKARQGKPFLWIQWSPDMLADVQSGWLTLRYQLRLAASEVSEWEYFYVGREAQFALFSFLPDSMYTAQVQCKADYGIWSEWSPRASIWTPVAPGIMMTAVRTVISVLSCLLGLTLIAVFFMNFKRVKNHFLPPIPVPRIKGFDIKTGWPSDILGEFSFPSFTFLEDIEDEPADVVEVVMATRDPHASVGDELVNLGSVAVSMDMERDSKFVDHDSHALRPGNTWDIILKRNPMETSGTYLKEGEILSGKLDNLYHSSASDCPVVINLHPLTLLMGTSPLPTPNPRGEGVCVDGALAGHIEKQCPWGGLVLEALSTQSLAPAFMQYVVMPAGGRLLASEPGVSGADESLRPSRLEYTKILRLDHESAQCFLSTDPSVTSDGPTLLGEAMTAEVPGDGQ